MSCKSRMTLAALVLGAGLFTAPLSIYAMSSESDVETSSSEATSYTVVSHENAEEDGTTKSETAVVDAADETVENPFTDEGNGTEEDYATSSDEKEFYVIETPRGNDFYLIIDKQGTGKNVYLTSLVTEEELEAMAEESEDGSTGASSLSEESVFGSSGGEAEKASTVESEAEAVSEDKEVTDTGSKTPLGILIAFAVLVIGAAAFVKIKKNGAIEGDMEFEDDDDYAPDDRQEKKPEGSIENAPHEEADEKEDEEDE